jgi:hypothetical protein
VDTPKAFDRQVKIDGAEFFLERKPRTDARILKDDIERVLGHAADVRLDRYTLASRASDIGNVGQKWQSMANWMAATERAIMPDNIERLIICLGASVAQEIRLTRNRKRILVMGNRPDESHNEWIFADAANNLARSYHFPVIVPPTADRSERG